MAYYVEINEDDRISEVVKSNPFPVGNSDKGNLALPCDKGPTVTALELAGLDGLFFPAIR